MSCLRLKAPRLACTLFLNLTGMQLGVHCSPWHRIHHTLYCSCSAADVNLLKVPDELDDTKLVLLLNIMSTGRHGARLDL